MKTIRLMGEVDGKHRLTVQVPTDVPPGRVAVAIIVPSQTEVATEEDVAGDVWAKGIASEWADELADVRQDIYSLEDGEPVNGRG